MHTTSYKKNRFGFKDQAFCYRNQGKLTQWVDEACTDHDQAEFDTLLETVKQSGYKYKIGYIHGGRRLFIDVQYLKDELN